MGISSLLGLRAVFRKYGVRTLYVKELALKQDNEKNQIVLGREVADLTTVLPGLMSVRQPSQSELKRKSDLGRPITEATIKLYWLDTEGNSFRAPGARLIDYFQYPEARLSGFLANCVWVPDAIRRNRQAAYGRRILFLGANAESNVYALLLTERDDPLVDAMPALQASGVTSILSTLSVETSGIASPAELLADKLSTVIDQGWHDSVRNRDGVIIPFKGNQGAGYTLEALLGVKTNANKEPDIHGHELKSFRGSKISLMTPTADGGPEGDLPFRDFMKRFGKPGKKGDGSVRFTGVARVGKINRQSGLSLRVAGYDKFSDRFSTNPDEIRIEQYLVETNDVISIWSLAHLARGWNRKHAYSAYVRAEADHNNPHRYRYLRPFYMCEGTSVWRFLRAVASGTVYYDPAHSVYSDGEAKQRPQWRVSTANFESVLLELYENVRVME